MRIHFPLLSIFLDLWPLRSTCHCFFILLRFVASVSSSLRKSFISSSHLFLTLPTGVHVWCLVLRPGFHSAAFFPHRSSGSDAIVIANLQFHSSVCFNPAWCFWLLSSFQWLSLCFSPSIQSILPFNFSCVNLFIGIFHAGDVTVLIAICV